MGSLVVLVNKRADQGRIQDFKLGGGALKKNAPSGGRRENFCVPEIETGRHVKNNACAVEIKIKWMIRKHMTHENTYRDDN
jgi:hypothetical protein